MRLASPAVRVLFVKELRQLLRNRQAIFSATLLPLLLLVVVPALQLYGFSRASNPSDAARTGATPLPGISGMTAHDVLALYLLPLFVCLAGVLAPAVTSVFTIVNERERRTVELLVALPVRVTEIITAKLAATVAAIAVVTLPLTVLDGIAAVALLGQGVLYAPLLVLLLLGGMVASTCLSAVLAILARDYRTSQQLSGLLVFPVLVLANGVLLLVPGLARLPVLTVLLAASGALVAWLVSRRFSFERYLG